MVVQSRIFNTGISNLWVDKMDNEQKICIVDPSHRTSQKSFVKNGIDIHVCPDCGCIMANTNFCQDQYETDAYYTMSQKTALAIEYEWGFRWRYILKRIAEIGGPSLLDVGAGNGYFVALAAKEFSLDASGLEVSKEEIRFAKDILNVQLIEEDVSQHSLTYDVVTCFNVLEHVVDPRSFLSALIKRMKLGGYLVLSTPNPGCIHRRVKGLKNWNMVAPPHHINLFTKKSLDVLVARENLTLVDYQTLSTYIKFIRKFDNNNLVLRKLFFDLLKVFGLGADHFLIARKQSY